MSTYPTPPKITEPCTTCTEIKNKMFPNADIKLANVYTPEEVQKQGKFQYKVLKKPESVKRPLSSSSRPSRKISDRVSESRSESESGSMSESEDEGILSYEEVEWDSISGIPPRIKSMKELIKRSKTGDRVVEGRILEVDGVRKFYVNNKEVSEHDFYAKFMKRR